MFKHITEEQQNAKARKQVDLQGMKIDEQTEKTEKTEAQALFTAIMTDTVLDDEDNEEA